MQVLLVFERTGTRGSFEFNIFQPQKKYFILFLNTNWGIANKIKYPHNTGCVFSFNRYTILK